MKNIHIGFLGVMMLALAPDAVCAQEVGAASASTHWGVFLFGVMSIALAGLFLTKVWLGVISVHWIEFHGQERKTQGDPPFSAVLFTVLSTLAIIAFVAHGGGAIAPFTGEGGMLRAFIFFGIAGLAIGIAEWRWRPVREYAFAFGLGSLLTFAILGFSRTVFAGQAGKDPFAVALGIVCVCALWRMLFGPWTAHIKVTVLGTFIGLMTLHMLWPEEPQQLKAHLLAILIALIPAGIWCALFLQEHKQKKSTVLLMFFAGMLSTVPILFYDAVVRSGAKLQFFLFTITPESFSLSSSVFVTGSLSPMPDIRTTLLSTLITFMIVGLMEEASKMWVVSRSARVVVSSIDDVLQLSVIVAIGFAFAENILNPTYFLAFLQQYLLTPSSPAWGDFLGNVVGRSILTSMVHILSTGVLGYFLGLAIFAGPVVSDVERDGREYLVAFALSRVLRLSEKAVFRGQMLVTGLVLATVLHGLFNFTVTLPDLLPSHPRTLGDLLSASEGSFLHSISFLLIPSLFYLVGGFWVLTSLFARRESAKERGLPVMNDAFVREEAMA